MATPSQRYADVFWPQGMMDAYGGSTPAEGQTAARSGWFMDPNAAQAILDQVKSGVIQREQAIPLLDQLIDPAAYSAWETGANQNFDAAKKAGQWSYDSPLYGIGLIAGAGALGGAFGGNALFGGGGSNALAGGAGADTLGTGGIDPILGGAENYGTLAGAGGTGASAGGGGIWDAIKGVAGGSSSGGMDWTKLLGPAISSALGLYGASKIGDATESAAKTSADATQQALALQKEQFDKNQENFKPWLTAGTGAVNQLATGLAPGGSMSGKVDMTGWETDPGYSFRLGEGLKALERSASARGGLLSGSTLKGINRYAQDYGSNEYSNVYGRRSAENTNTVNRLLSLAGLGQTANSQAANVGQNYAGNAGNLIIGNAANQANAGLTAANANASSYLGLGNAVQNALAPNYFEQFIRSMGRGY